MYNEQELTEVSKQLKMAKTRVFSVFLIIFAVSILLAVKVSNTVGMILLVLGVCGSIFFWGVYVNPLKLYRQFLNDILMGQRRTLIGKVKKINDEPNYKENRLYYYEIIVDEDNVERQLLMDANKPIPALEIGKDYIFSMYETFIIDVVLL